MNCLRDPVRERELRHNHTPAIPRGFERDVLNELKRLGASTGRLAQLYGTHGITIHRALTLRPGYHRGVLRHAGVELLTVVQQMIRSGAHKIGDALDMEAIKRYAGDAHK